MSDQVGSWGREERLDLEEIYQPGHGLCLVGGTVVLELEISIPKPWSLLFQCLRKFIYESAHGRLVAVAL